jgi:hypothetical protein
MPDVARDTAPDDDPSRMAEARNQLLSVAQWLARVERSFAADSPAAELNLRWIGDRGTIATHDFGDGVGLELRIDGLTMQFTESGLPSDHEIDVDDRSPAHVEAWILIELLHRGLDRERFSKNLPYDTSALLNGDGVEFSPQSFEAELRELDRLFRVAAEAIGRVAANGAGTQARISPQDLRVEATAHGRTVGFSPGDAAVAEPHFYVRTSTGRDGAAILPAAKLGSGVGPDAVAEFYAENGARTRH